MATDVHTAAEGKLVCMLLHTDCWQVVVEPGLQKHNSGLAVALCTPEAMHWPCKRKSSHLHVRWLGVEEEDKACKTGVCMIQAV